MAESILSLVKGTASLVGSVVATCLVMNMTASDQYLALVVPGRMFRKVLMILIYITKSITSTRGLGYRYLCLGSMELRWHLSIQKFLE